MQRRGLPPSPSQIPNAKANRHANAILEAWYPGEEGGAAVAETLAGRNNPAGRLPVTFYTGVDQLPPFENYFMRGRTYRYFDGKPLYPFGYGLSYTPAFHTASSVFPIKQSTREARLWPKRL
jgi:beta-glucosidase